MAPVPQPGGATELPDGVEEAGRLLRLRLGDLDIALNPRRGLAVASFIDRSVSERSLFGSIEHGYFETIELSADWYTGNLVQEAPLRHKVTDLEPMAPVFSVEDGRVSVHGVADTALGAIEKTVTIDPESGAIGITWTLRWPELPDGSLRIGHVTLHPESFERDSLWFATHNGSRELERHQLDGPPFDHGAPVSALVSARQGLGVSEGLLLIGDAQRHIRIEIDQALAKPLGLVTFQPAGEHYFLRCAFSLTESDETRRGGIPREADAPQRARIRFCARAGS